MSPKLTGVMVAIAALALVVGYGDSRQTPPKVPAPKQVPVYTPVYTKDGDLALPAEYREWVYLSSGFDMSYNPNVQTASPHVFDNVFVNPSAYHAFLQTGSWPERTALILENRAAEGRGSINRAGSYQSSKVTGLEVHLKDSSRFPGGWAFFGFGNRKVGKLFSQSAGCQSCHSDHAAVDTTFVQFYPTLLPVAQQHHTLSADYIKESGADRP